MLVISRRVRLIFFILLLFFPPFVRSHAASTRQNEQTGLIDAVESGLVEAWAQPNPATIGFKQPLIILHIRNMSDSPLDINIPAGLHLLASDTKHADLMVAKEAVAAGVVDESTVSLNALSLQHDRALPSGMEEEYRYSTSGMGEGGLLVLVNQIVKDGNAGNMGAQIAVWSITASQTPDQLAMGFMSPVRPEDIAAANGLLKKINWQKITTSPLNPTEPSNNRETPPTGQTGPGDDEGTFIAGWIGIAVVIGLIGAVGVRAGVLKRKTIAARQPTQANDNLSKTNSGPKISHQNQTILTLSGRAGPHTGKIIQIKKATVISRSDLNWFALTDDGILSPHVIVDFSSSPYQLKNLVSEDTAWLDEVSLGKNFVEWPVGSRLRLGNQANLIPLESGLMVESGQQIGRTIHRSERNTLISRERLEVISFGSDDPRISEAHAVFKNQSGAWSVKDLNSSNGVLVNDERIFSETLLKSGDRLLVGKSEFEIKIDEFERRTREEI